YPHRRAVHHHRRRQVGGAHDPCRSALSASSVDRGEEILALRAERRAPSPVRRRAAAAAAALALWAHRSLPLKNTLTAADAQAVEAAYLAKVAGPSEDQPALDDTATSSGQPPQSQNGEPCSDAHGLVSERPVRKRSKAHLAFV